MPIKLKTKIYKTVVGTVITCVAVFWALNKRDEKRLDVMGMRMRRRILEVNLNDTI